MEYISTARMEMKICPLIGQNGKVLAGEEELGPLSQLKVKGVRERGYRVMWPENEQHPS